MTDDGDITPMFESAVAMYEFFTSYVEAGFTERQAMQLIAAIVTANGPKADEE